MTRVIAGTAGGQRLLTPRGRATRPTSDRVREALFSRLEHLGALEQATVLDLYCGSGALGLEAASRGAARVVLVDQNRAAGEAARANAATLRRAGVDSEVEIRQDSVARFLAGPALTHPVDLALIDPPYDLPEQDLHEVLALLLPWLAPQALVVVERSARSAAPDWPPPLRPADDRRYGETRIWFAQAP